MKYILRLILILLFQMSFGTYIFCQIWLSNKDIYDDAEEYLDAEEYVEALPLYMLLEKKEIINSNISYKIGICYLNIRGQKDKSISYLENACQNITFNYQNSIEETKAPLKAIMMLGIAYRINNEPKKAIKIFESLRDTLANNDLEMDAIIDMHIRRCENAILLAAFPGEPRTEKLPGQINDEFSNYNPVLVRHDSVLYYMEELKFYDALMQVQMEDEGWGIPNNLTPKIGSDGDHILVGASSDGSQLLLYLYEVLKAGEIYTTRLTEDGWSGLESLNKNINTKYHETHASFSADGKTLYFTSNRPEGYGGLDIYMSEIDENGDWGPAVNLGSTINTPFNEENPIMNVDNEILYFSSQGHLNMGGYDIFRAQRKGKNEWRQPINMGSPVSTTDDDLFYFPLEEGVSGLMSRLEKPGNTLYDIYRYNSMVFANSPRFTLRGRSETTDSTNYKDQQVLVINSETSDTLIQTSPNPDGSYEFLLPAGSFSVSVIDNSGKSSEGTIVFNEGDTDKELVTSIQASLPVDSLVAEGIARDTLRLKHILFGFDSYKISEESKIFLDELRNWMEKYDSITFQIIGYTDAVGSDSYNLKLSKLRAEKIVNYLSSNSVAKERFKIVAKGESNPIAMNTNADGTDCPEGRRYNRRVEIEPIYEISGVLFLIEIEIPEAFIQKQK
ncbi:MAG: OmpA family protein [Bacteroidales bacterium]|nr:OmpA family protein [Bacteroidales bacterium]